MIVKLGKIWAASLLGALAASLASAETKRVESPTRLARLATEAAASADVDWEVRDPVATESEVFFSRDGKTELVFWAISVDTVVISDVIDWDAQQRTKTVWLVHCPAVKPEPGPGPGPGPNPPPPTEAPFPAPGLTVIIIIDSQAAEALPADQVAIFSSPEVTDYLKSKCHQIAANNIAYRRWDDDVTDQQLTQTAPFLRVFIMWSVASPDSAK